MIVSRSSTAFRRFSILAALILVVIGIVIGAFLLHASQRASALSTSDWKAGDIISDQVFTNKTALSASQIQSFLNAKMPNCDTNGSKPSEMNNSGVPDYNKDGIIQRWEWGKKKYGQTKFPCLRDYKENDKTAAQIIYDVAQEFSINPQVLIVLLQKEQSLVTDTWPLKIQYKTATGYGCPDTAACNTKYYGLTRQLTWAATSFRVIVNGGGAWSNDYKSGTSWYMPYSLGKNDILYNPNVDCGDKSVNILNGATRALYNYTPYTPNGKVIKWKLGSGGSVSSSYPDCGAFGNINFFVYFNTWFGSTHYVTPPFTFKSLLGSSGSTNNVSGSYGQFTASVSVEGVPHVFSYDSANGDLKHTYLKGSEWKTETIDGSTGTQTTGATPHDVGKYVSAAYSSSKKTIYVYYYDQVDGALRTAYFKNGKWKAITLDGTAASQTGRSDDNGLWTSAVMKGNSQQVYYYNASIGSLRHMWWANNKWHIETLDGTTTSKAKHDTDMGKYVSAVMNGSQQQVYYYDATNGNLRYMYDKDGKWHSRSLDGSLGSETGRSENTGLHIQAMRENNQNSVYYYNQEHGSLRHMWVSDGKWKSETIDGTTTSKIGASDDSGVMPAVVNYKGIRYVFYYSNTTHAWRVAQYDSKQRWRAFTLDGTSDSIARSSAATGGELTVLPANGTLYVFYPRTTTNNLYRAYL